MDRADVESDDWVHEDIRELHCYVEVRGACTLWAHAAMRRDSILPLHKSRLSEPLLRRRPTVYFVNSMSDLFHKGVADSRTHGRGTRSFARLRSTEESRTPQFTERSEDPALFVTFAASRGGASTSLDSCRSMRPATQAPVGHGGECLRCQVRIARHRLVGFPAAEFHQLRERNAALQSYASLTIPRRKRIGIYLCNFLQSHFVSRSNPFTLGRDFFIGLVIGERGESSP